MDTTNQTETSSEKSFDVIKGLLSLLKKSKNIFLFFTLSLIFLLSFHVQNLILENNLMIHIENLKLSAILNEIIDPGGLILGMIIDSLPSFLLIWSIYFYMYSYVGKYPKEHDIALDIISFFARLPGTVILWISACLLGFSFSLIYNGNYNTDTWILLAMSTLIVLLGLIVRDMGLPYRNKPPYLHRFTIIKSLSKNSNFGMVKPKRTAVILALSSITITILSSTFESIKLGIALYSDITTSIANNSGL